MCAARSACRCADPARRPTRADRTHPSRHYGSCGGEGGDVVVAREFKALGREDVHVIPGHPIAGTEKSGPDAGFASLFENRWFIITPETGGSAEYVAATDNLAAFWSMLGSKVDL